VPINLYAANEVSGPGTAKKRCIFGILVILRAPAAEYLAAIWYRIADISSFF